MVMNRKARTFFLLVCLISLCGSAYGFEASENMRIQSLKWNENKNEYDLNIVGRAAVYHAKKDSYSCLSHSMQKKKQVLLKFDVATLQVKSCTILKGD